MTKGILISGSHSRHLHVHRSLLDLFNEVIVIVMKRESVPPQIPSNIPLIDQENFRIHFEKRRTAELNAYGDINYRTAFKDVNYKIISEEELNSPKICKLVERVCIGCGRSQDEIRDWVIMTDKERQRVFQAVESGERMTEATVRVLVKGSKRKTKSGSPRTESEKIKSLKEKIEIYKKMIHSLQDENRKLSKLLSNRKQIIP